MCYHNLILDPYREIEQKLMDPLSLIGLISSVASIALVIVLSKFIFVPSESALLYVQDNVLLGFTQFYEWLNYSHVEVICST